MNKYIKIGIGFGLTSGIITTLGLIMGLSAGTHLKMVVIAGILTIAIADAFSDALGIHISEETAKDTTIKEIWEATASTFFAKLVFASLFIVPFILYDINLARIVCIAMGLIILGIFSYFIGLVRGMKPWKPVLEHLLIAIVVIFITNFVGIQIANYFNTN